MSADRIDAPHEGTPAYQKLQAALLASAGSDEQMTLREVFQRVWRGKWTVIITAMFFVAAVSIWMKSVSPLYTAKIVVAPASGGSSGMAARLSRYSGVAALAGIDLPADETVTPFSQFSEVITSPLVADRLAKKHGILPRVFKGAWTWNAESKSWTRKQGLLTPLKDWLRGFFNLPPRAEPSANALASILKQKLAIRLVKNSGMQLIQIRHKDPVFAANLLTWLHQESDNLIREEAEARTSRQIAYIDQKLRTVTAADHRRSLVELLLDQEKQMMMIQVDLPFAARIIEPAIASDDPTFPRPPLFLLVAGVGGLIIGVCLAFLIQVTRRQPDRSRPGDSEPSTGGVAEAVELEPKVARDG